MRRALSPFALSASFALGLVIAAPASAQDGVQQRDENDPSQSIAWHSAQQTYLLGLKAADGWHYIDGGVRWRWLEYNGTENRPDISDTVTVHYEGKLINGRVFDTSFTRSKPATFPLRALIPGWQLAIPKMSVGEIIEIAVPSDLAYGPVGRGPIPGNATLVFKIELFDIAE